MSLSSAGDPAPLGPGLPFSAATPVRGVTPDARSHRSPPARATLRTRPSPGGDEACLALFSYDVKEYLDRTKRDRTTDDLGRRCRTPAFDP